MRVLSLIQERPQAFVQRSIVS